MKRRLDELFISELWSADPTCLRLRDTAFHRDCDLTNKNEESNAWIVRP
jgi:hypothetical protein